MKLVKKYLSAGVGGILVSAMALAVAVVSAQTAVAKSKGGTCTPMSFTVAPAEGQPATWTVAATYCQPTKWANGPHRLDVLTHGAGYNQTYWDWPQDPETYSYVDKTLDAGRATLAYDRVGNGASTRPVSTAITMESDAYVLRQLIQNFSGEYSYITSVGHSYGSGVVIREAAVYQDVDGVVITGYLHRPSNPAVSTANYPANQDPAFASAGLDNGYLTSRPGTRAQSFYSASADPAVIAYDEAHKDLVSLTGLLDFLGERQAPAASNISSAIQVPVLVIAGEQDAIFCHDPAVFDCSDINTVRAHETPFYAGSPDLTVVMVADTGHDLTLHPSANTSFHDIDKWIKKES